ncbi:hypothetical protein HPB50_012954 [Hyalomma asiaticum]|uniref:Uncharacterized protein n=1 Tax=Hyalomma asiaticum TaxID=266040 RepID=A0ACB7RUY8_HYAAI|nr:hypothetical protein HPB50_012954 [Hyalomma asiaticum]
MEDLSLHFGIAVRMPPGPVVSTKPLDVWYLGSLDSGLHGIRGTVYAASGDTLVLRGFSYDGRAPGARFIVGRGRSPDGNGIVLKDESGSYKALKAYRNQTVVLKLTPGYSITDFKWFSVYDRKAKRSFAHVVIPANLPLPRSMTVATHLVGDHANVTAIIIEDQSTLLLKNFYFDGSVPDTYFLVGKGDKPGPSSGVKIPDEKGRKHALGMYAGANLRLTLPENMTVDDIDWFAVSCTKCTRSLVQGTIPKRVNVPQNSRWIKRKSRLGLLRMQDPAPDDPDQFPNCETIIADKIQVGWHLAGDTITIHVRAVAGPYMWTSFGVSGDPDKNKMEGADVAVVSVIGTKVQVDDYYLTAKAQCSGGIGVCPDTAQSGTDSLTVKKTSFQDGIVDAVYSRQLNTGDDKDQDIDPDGTVMVAAQGPLNMDKPDTVLFHVMVYTASSASPIKLEFNRDPPARNCPTLPGAPTSTVVAPKSKYFGGHDIPKSAGVKVFTARIGPTASEELGYKAITGMFGWGIAWWINGQLIPVLHLERGQKYKFIVEGGNDRTFGAQYHPFYITDSHVGGGSKADKSTIGKPCWTHNYLGWKIKVSNKGEDLGPKPPATKRKTRPKKPPSPPAKPPEKKPEQSPPSGGSGGSGGSGESVQPALAPFLFGCAAVLVTLLIRRHARDGHLLWPLVAVNH